MPLVSTYLQEVQQFSTGRCLSVVIVVSCEAVSSLIAKPASAGEREGRKVYRGGKGEEGMREGGREGVREDGREGEVIEFWFTFPAHTSWRIALLICSRVRRT